MLRQYIGDIGHLSVIISFITSIVAALAYYNATQAQKDSLQKDNSWLTFARIAFAIHGIAVMGIVLSLFTIIYKNYFEFHYAWEHASKNLPTHFMISCFWEGQEGSFLLWIFWHVILGGILIRTNKAWEAPVMTIFALVQAFLASMILGVVLYDYKLGSSPFIMLRDFMVDAPIFKMKPDYVPEDGTGLNPLLQNYWMVIHPPTLFLGFATTLIPFSFCIAGLWLKKYKEWIRPALPWALFSALVLGLGILMGGYWAYETLNFGGYWNWDPVENAVYVPWLVLVAALHTMLIFKNNETALKTTIVLTIASFLLILYSTFLTRSGILGNASVHSFTDLGLSGQLFLYMMAFVLIAIVLMAWRWKELPTTEKEESVYSREFWIFIGALTLCLAAFQIIATTSIPVYNAFLGLFSIKSTLAPPADQAVFYSNWQLWFMAFVAIFSGIGQFFFWKKIDKEKLSEVLYIPFIITLIVSLGLIVFTKVQDMRYMTLLTTSVFTVVCNLTILKGFLSKNIKLAGGAVAHIGIGMMLLGILYSAGYSKIVSLNVSGLVYSKDFSEDMNKENLLIFRNTPQQMQDYTLTYRGPRIEAEGYPGYIDKEAVRLSGTDPFKVIARKEIKLQDKVYFKAGDTIRTTPENTFYEIEYKKPDGATFSLFPRTQVNPQMGFLASPDIKRGLTSDLYTHIASVPDAEKERNWSKVDTHVVAVGDTFLINDYYAILKKVEQVDHVEDVAMAAGDIAVKAHILVLTKDDKDYMLYPHYIIKDQMVGRVPEIIEDLGVKMTFNHIDPVKGLLTFGVSSTQKDWVILKAMEKPYINVLWLGSLIVLIGLGIAIVRRYKEFTLMRDKGLF
ncbi:MAG: cytochrome c biosis protein CcsA [Bacteroidota bacterium]